MLVLSRQRDETIMIGDEVEITVVDVRGDKVRLGITAPARIAVHRKEVYDAIKAENEQAARSAGSGLDALPAALAGGPARLKSQGKGAASLLSPRAAPVAPAAARRRA
ncbi:MAG: carbon storage regulator CsrA [Planctomycetota bacterium]|nr:carbon storage regulator CsrA [Planctomycetota bacterium]